MNDLIHPLPNGDASSMRKDFIPSDRYTSAEFAKLEKKNLWQKVWQVACRVEDVPTVGSYFTYDVADQSIIVVRVTQDEIKAFHNVCPHRGRRLKEGAGTSTKFVCGFHGWQWSLDGRLKSIPEREEWQDCPAMGDEDLKLTECSADTWGGWVFINMDPGCEPFAEFIHPVPDFVDCLDFDKMRYAWSKSFVLKANWKTALEPFMESYHVPITHPQALPLVDNPSFGSAHGQHGKHTYLWERPPGAPSRLTNLPFPSDWRKAIIALYEWNCAEVGGHHRDGQSSDRSSKAVLRLLDEVAEDAPYEEVMMKAAQFCAEAAIAEGAGWPQMTPEQAGNLGADWNIFPNMVLVFSMDATVVMRARPINDNPNECLMEMSSIVRYGPDSQPPFKREFYDTWQNHREKIPHLLTQDLSNIEAVQAGMGSIAFKGARPNPKQELQIVHHHEVLDQYLNGQRPHTRDAAK